MKFQDYCNWLYARQIAFNVSYNRDGAWRITITDSVDKGHVDMLLNMNVDCNYVTVSHNGIIMIDVPPE